jgi:hypothetical protein
VQAFCYSWRLWCFCCLWGCCWPYCCRHSCPLLASHRVLAVDCVPDLAGFPAVAVQASLQLQETLLMGASSLLLGSLLLLASLLLLFWGLGNCWPPCCFWWPSWYLRGRIQGKTWCMGPYVGVDCNLTLCPLRVDYDTCTMGNPMPELTLSSCQELRIWPLSKQCPLYTYAFIWTSARQCHDDSSPFLPSPYVFSGIMRSLEDASFGHFLLWTKSPLDKESLTNLSRPWTAYRWWITTTATCRNWVIRALLEIKTLFSVFLLFSYEWSMILSVIFNLSIVPHQHQYPKFSFFQKKNSLQN